MGMFVKFSDSSFDKKLSGNMLARNAGSSSRVVYVNEEPKTLPDPRPENYEILDHREYAYGYLLVVIKYLDCKNYEGQKVLVFKNCSMNQLLEQKLIDPHFSENKSFHSPIARFEPTKEGINNAIIFINALGDK